MKSPQLTGWLHPTCTYRTASFDCETKIHNRTALLNNAKRWVKVCDRLEIHSDHNANQLVEIAINLDETISKR